MKGAASIRKSNLYRKKLGNQKASLLYWNPEFNSIGKFWNDALPTQELGPRHISADPPGGKHQNRQKSNCSMFLGVTI